MALPVESEGLILFNRDYKEKDKLVKIFTESSGKLMFFVKGVHRRNSPLASAVLPFTKAVYIGDFRPEGLSFLNGAKYIEPYRKLQEDIFLNAYGSYLLGLADAAIEDRTYDPHLYNFTKQALTMMNEGYDGETILNIYEVQIMERFGVKLNWQQCGVCGRTTGVFDFSSKYNGILCSHHWECDRNRYHADPKAIYFLRMFSAISYEQVKSVTLQESTKKAIRQTLDLLYEEYIGLNLKSKKFIDQMNEWSDLLKKPKE